MSKMLSVNHIFKQAWANTRGMKGRYLLALFLSGCLIVLVLFVLGRILPGFTPDQTDLSPSQLPSLVNALESKFSWGYISHLLIQNLLGYLVLSGLIYLSLRRYQRLRIKALDVFHGFSPAILLRLTGLVLIKLAIGSLVFLGLQFTAIKLTLLLRGNETALADSTLFAVMAASWLLACLILLVIHARLLLGIPLVLDTKAGPIQALAMSIQLTQGHFFKILYLISIPILLMIAPYAVLVLITLSQIPGLQLLSVALFFAIIFTTIWILPFTTNIMIGIYQQLHGLSSQSKLRA